MKILAIETSSDACSAALAVDGEILEVYRVAPREHTRLILSMVEEVLALGACPLSMIDAIAFGRGPGAFTGVRVAASVAQGIAFGADLPVIPVSSLAAIASYGQRNFDMAHSFVAVDARLGEVYSGRYILQGPSANLVGNECVLKPDLLPLIEEGEWLGIGSGWGIFEDQLSSRIAQGVSRIESDVNPHAYDVAYLAQQLTPLSAELALPVYLRDNVTS